MSCAAVWLLVLAGSAGAQHAPGPAGVLPNQQWPELPAIQRPADAERPVLPKAPDPPPGSAIARGLDIEVREIFIRGNTALPEATLAAVAQPFVARRTLTSEDLRALQHALTALYVNAGYATSGARIPDQDVANGVLVVEIVEGRLSSVDFEGNHRFRDGYLRSRVAPHPDAPLDIFTLERRLQQLQSDPRILAVRAELQPEHRVGEARLHVDIVERSPLDLSAQVSNDRPVAIGPVNLRMAAAYASPLGLGDGFFVDGTVSKGLGEIRARYEIPLNRFDTRFSARVRYSASQVVEAPFDVLDLDTDFLNVGLLLGQPFLRTTKRNFEIGLMAEWSRSRSQLAGFPIDFTPATSQGELQISVLRVYASASWRDRKQVLAARTTASFGLNVLGATSNPGRLEDGEMISWLTQLQWIRRFDGLRGSELRGRFDVQLADRPLPALERSSLGGRYSVRGYRENTFVRDQGLSGSIELRVPIKRRPDGTPVVELVPFFDFGRAWMRGRGFQPETTWLASPGIGVRAQPYSWLEIEVYWGGRLVEVPDPGTSLQDDGLYFSITASRF